jgi:hypothetical protein
VEISPSVVVFDSTCKDLFNQIPPKKEKLYDNSHKFQNAWTTCLPWVEFVVDEKGSVQQVRCKICTFVEGKEKFLAPKVDSFIKHVGIRKLQFLCQVLMLIFITTIKF